MKIPEKIKCIGHDIEVIQTEKIKIGDEEEHGTATLINSQIYIADNARDLPVSEAVKAETLLHELIHHIDWAFQLKLSERQVNGTARGLIAVIRDNNLDFNNRE